MLTPELIKTDDGSDTLFNTELGEHYHSTHGAIQESMHVFIQAGFRTCQQSSLTIFEVGFGTGLNTYLTLLETLKTNQRIRYITVEKYPLSRKTWEALNYPQALPGGGQKFFLKIHEAAWNEEVPINDQFTLLKLSSDLTAIDFSDLPFFDLVYFDAFSPDKQAELWVSSVFRKVSDHCVIEAKIVTYCAKGAVRRTLSEVGFKAERIPGPPGKREMLRGTKNKKP